MQRPSDLRPAWVSIDLDAVESNLHRLRRPGLDLRAVVKADAYGHGAVPLARHLSALGIERLAVALVEEGIELRRAGCSADILVMGPNQPEQCGAISDNRLVPTISGESQLRSWLGRPVDASLQRVHLKVNSGMNRLGFAASELAEALAAVRASPGLELAGLMSHLATADDPGASQTDQQESSFTELLELLNPEERSSIEIHLSNSAAVLHRGGGPTNVARPGLALLGYDPGRRDNGLTPVMSVKARVGQIQRLAAGEAVGYGGRWRASRPSRVAVVPLGYADGYPWRLGGRAEALLDGRRVAVVGAVSMDMLTLDATDSEAAEDAEVTLLGAEGGEVIDAFELADHAGTIPYELLCGFGRRLPRIYRLDRKTVEVASHFFES